MRAIVTGATGVVGKYLVRELIENTSGVEQVVALSRKNRYRYEDHPDRANALLLDCWGDLRLNCTRLITQFKPDVVFHCAGIATQNSPPRELWEANVNTTLNLLEACKRLDDKVKFIYSSSITLYDKKTTLYSASKMSGELLIKSFSDMHNNIEGISVRFPAVVGSGNKHGVVKAIVEKLLDNNKEQLDLLNNSRKPFVYAGQLANKKVALALSNYISSPLNLCPDDNISVDEIVDEASVLTGIQKSILWNDGAAWKFDNSKVSPVSSYSNMFSSSIAVRKGIRDILREDYGFTN